MIPIDRSRLLFVNDIYQSICLRSSVGRRGSSSTRPVMTDSFPSLQLRFRVSINLRLCFSSSYYRRRQIIFWESTIKVDGVIYKSEYLEKSRTHFQFCNLRYDVGKIMIMMMMMIITILYPKVTTVSKTLNLLTNFICSVRNHGQADIFFIITFQISVVLSCGQQQKKSKFRPNDWIPSCG